MKRFILTLTAIFICTIARSDEITINWMNTDKTIDHTTTCTIGGDVNVPIPTKYGYTFNGWRANYTPIEYLESTGTQYIDTGFYPNRNTSIKIKMQLNYSSNGPYGFGTEHKYEFFVWSSIITFVYSSEYKGNKISTDDILEVDWNKNRIKYYINGVFQEQITALYSDFHISYPLYLFALNRGTSVPEFAGGVKIYYTKLYDNDVLVRDFVPVLDLAGTPCMYDRVEGKFYYNAGTGDFIAGPVIGE